MSDTTMSMFLGEFVVELSTRLGVDPKFVGIVEITTDGVRVMYGPSWASERGLPLRVMTAANRPDVLAALKKGSAR